MDFVKRLIGVLVPTREKIYLAQTRDGRIVALPERTARRAGLVETGRDDRCSPVTLRLFALKARCDAGIVRRFRR